MRIHELQHFALGDHVGRVGHDFHDAVRPGRRHDLERARVDEIPDQDAGLVAEHLVCGVAAAALRGMVHDIVMQQSCRMDEFDEGCRLQMPGMTDQPAPAGGVGGKQHEQGPQALATAGNNMFGHLVDQGHGTLQAGADDCVNSGHVRAHQGANLV